MTTESHSDVRDDADAAGAATGGAGSVKGTVTKLLLAGVGMFAFGFALVPLYDVVCDVTGLNGKTAGQYDYVEADLSEDRSRMVSVRFITNNNAGMPWEFRPEQNAVRVFPGGLNEATFYARNTTDRPMIAQAVPSIAPSRAVEFFHKTECFCFDQQRLEPGEAIEMPLRFIVDKDLPAGVSSISLSYTMFDITGQMPMEDPDAPVGGTAAAGG